MSSPIEGRPYPLLINPAASTYDIAAVALARLNRFQFELDILACSGDVAAFDIPNLACMFKARVDEVQSLLAFVHARLRDAEKEANHG